MVPPFTVSVGEENTFKGFGNELVVERRVSRNTGQVTLKLYAGDSEKPITGYEAKTLLSTFITKCNIKVSSTAVAHRRCRHSSCLFMMTLTEHR